MDTVTEYWDYSIVLPCTTHLPEKHEEWITLFTTLFVILYIKCLTVQCVTVLGSQSVNGVFLNELMLFGYQLLLTRAGPQRDVKNQLFKLAQRWYTIHY